MQSDPSPRNQVPRTTPQRRLPHSDRVFHINNPPSPDSQDPTSDDEYIFTVNSQSTTPSHFSVNSLQSVQCMVHIAGVPTAVLIDSGASVNIIDEAAYHNLQRTRAQPLKLCSANVKIHAYGSQRPLTVLGKITTHIESKTRLTPAVMYVVKGTYGSLLSYPTASELNLIKLNVNAISAGGDNTLTSLETQYPSVFTGIGKLKDHQVKLHIDRNVAAVAQPHRRIPFHMRKKLETELERLEQQGIIEPVDGPTPWVSPVVVAPKPKNPNEIRMCIDMRLPNRAIQRERHVTPTVDDLIHDLNGSCVFSKIDLKSGYHQLELHPESRYITTFSTHKGLRQYTRLNFGTTSAAEIFQATIQQVLEGIDGARNISDDIIVFGKTKDDHDRALHAVFQRLQAKNLTVNPSKCEFNKSTLEFYGYVFSADGISPDPRKVGAIHAASPPENPQAVRSFLGMTNYCARFIPNYSTVAEPLRRLTKQNVNWEWTGSQEQAFLRLKELLTSKQTIAYFDPTADSRIFVDASPVGLGAILAQQKAPNGGYRVIAYASRSLTPVEQRYSQTEREALSIVWACEHFHLYIFGSPFTVITDHKPLEQIFANPTAKPNARIERWLLKLQQYQANIQYAPGKDNPADYMSRHPVPITTMTRAAQQAEEYIHFVAEHAVPKALTLPAVIEATKSDPTFQRLKELIQHNKWHNLFENPHPEVRTGELHALQKIRHELVLSANNDIILRGTQILLPSSLRHHALTLAHQGHQGIVKTKQLLREKVWFPGIDDAVKKLVEGCIPCQATTPSNVREPLQMSPLPEGPWQNLSTDFCGPFPSGDYLLVVMDEYSRYPEVELVSSTSATAVIPKLDRILSTHGIPDELITGPRSKVPSFLAISNT